MTCCRRLTDGGYFFFIIVCGDNIHLIVYAVTMEQGILKNIYRLVYWELCCHRTVECLLNNAQTISGKNTNKVLNDEWDKVYEEVKEAIIAAMSTIFRSLIGNFSKRVDYNELFL